MSTTTTKPITDTDDIFARAYASAVKSKLQLHVGPNHCLFVCSPAQRGIPAGKNIYEQMTNFLTYRLGDSLLDTTNPIYSGGSVGSYIGYLKSCLEWVDVGGTADQVALIALKDAKEKFDEAAAAYGDIERQAFEQFDKVKDTIYTNVTFWQWVAAGNAPSLSMADTTRKAAQGVYITAMSKVDGPDSGKKSVYYQKLVNSENHLQSMPGYNKPGMLEDKNLLNDQSGKNPQKNTTDGIYVPAYIMAGDYSGTIENWVAKANKTKTRGQEIKVSIDKAHQTSWEEYGFKEIKAGGEASMWPFFHAEVEVDGQYQERKLDTSDQEGAVTMKIAMRELQIFNIESGMWDVPNIKDEFSAGWLPGTPPEIVNSKAARAISAVVGYDIELTVEFASHLIEKVDAIYKEVESSKSKGRMTIFGFNVRVEGQESGATLETKFQNVAWDKSKGSMTLTPTAGSMYPTLLGVIGQKLNN